MQNNVSGSRVLVVGGNSGMGFALAQKLLASGADVTIAGRSAEKLAAARSLLGDAPTTIVCVIANEDEVAHLFAAIGPLDHIVSTAADMTGAYRLLPEVDVAAARRVIDGKILGPLLLAKHGAPNLRAGGSIIYTSGVAAYRPSVRGSVVAAVNAAIEGLVRALAIELAPVRVNAVSPGWVDTPIWSAVAGEQKEETLKAMAQRLPVGRIGRPEDIADAIHFLMVNGFTTGSTFHVEGGHRLI